MKPKFKSSGKMQAMHCKDSGQIRKPGKSHNSGSVMKTKSMKKKLVENKSMEKKSVENKSMDKKSVENKSMEKKSVENKSMEKKSVENKSMERKSVENKSMERKSVENKSMERKSVENKSMKKKSVENKSMKKSVENKSMKKKWVENKSMKKKSVKNKSTKKKPMKKFDKTLLTSREGKNLGKYGLSNSVTRIPWEVCHRRKLEKEEEDEEDEEEENHKGYLSPSFLLYQKKIMSEKARRLDLRIQARLWKIFECKKKRNEIYPKYEAQRYYVELLEKFVSRGQRRN